ncbi:MAG TPA: helix-turn-helix transcriptional regulator [Trebonia sp.]
MLQAQDEATPNVVFEANDDQSALALLSSLRGVVQIRSCGGEARIRVAHGSVGPVSFDHLTIGADLEVDVGPVNALVFGQVHSGTVRIRSDGAERRYTRGDVYLAGQPLRRRTSVVSVGEYEQAVIDPALISQVTQALGATAAAVHFTGYEAVSKQAAAMWTSAYDYVRDTVLGHPDAARYPLLAANAARLLAVTTLSAFPNDALASPTAQDRRDGSPVTLRRAVSFIDEHAREEITVTDIAAAASVTARAVQLAFRRHLNTTPTAYLRRVRLEHAHRQLVAADPGHESVTAVAYRWGFPNPSRFAAAYRQAYGVAPSRSLRG